MTTGLDHEQAFKELQGRYDQLAQQHHLLSIRLVHRNFLLHSAARMLEAENFPDLWREVEDILANMSGLPVFWVVAHTQTGPLHYASAEAQSRGIDVARALLNRNLSWVEFKSDWDFGEVREVPLAGGPSLACLRFRSLHGGLALYNEADQELARWRTERELLTAVLAILPSAIEGLSRRQIIAEAAIRDPLTGLYNRREFGRRFEQELSRCQRGAKPMAVAMIDLDHFKKVNDTFGHLQGDQVLREIAERLGRTLRNEDVVGRYGGEEFVVALPECDTADARQVAERLREAICGHPVTRLDGEGEIPVTGSIGVTSVITPPWPGAEEILARADHALFRAKHAGRNRVVVASFGEP